MPGNTGTSVSVIASPPPTATDARLAGDDKQTRLVMDLSHKVDMRAFTLADPYRIVIDLPQMTFQLPAHTGENGRGLIKAFAGGVAATAATGGGAYSALVPGIPIWRLSLPKLRESSITRKRESRRAISWSRARVLSRLPSSTQTISNRSFTRLSINFKIEQ